MFKSLTTITELNNYLHLGIVCLFDNNNSGGASFSFITTNSNLITHLSPNKAIMLEFSPEESMGDDDYNDDGSSSNSGILVYDILHQDTRYIYPHIYNGKTFFIASATSPDIQLNPVNLDLDLDSDVCTTDGRYASLIGEFQESVYNLVFAAKNDSGDGNDTGFDLFNVNKKGVNKDGNLTIINVNCMNKEVFGHLFLTDDKSPLFVSDKDFDNVKPSGLAMLIPACGIFAQDGSLSSFNLIKQEPKLLKENQE